MLDKLIDKLLKVDDRLSWPRIAMWVVLAVSCIALWFVWEDRANRIPQLLSSSWALLIACVVGVLALLWTGWNYVFGKIEQKNAELHDLMRGQMAEMREELKTERAHSARQDEAIFALQARDRACQEDLRLVRSRMTRYEQIIARAGLDFGNTE